MQRAAPLGDTGAVPADPRRRRRGRAGRPDGGAAARPPGARGARAGEACRALSAAPGRAPGRRGVPRAAGGRGGRRGAAAQPPDGRAAAARRRGTGCWPSSAGDPARGRTAGRRARSCTSPTSRTVLAPRPRRRAGGSPSARRRGHRPAPRTTTASRLTVADGGADRSVRAAAVLGCDGAGSTVRALIGASMRDLGPADRWLVLDVRSRRRRCRSGRARTRSATRARPATFMPVTGDRYRWECRLAPGETVADADDAGPARARCSRRSTPAAVEIVRAVEYTFRAQVADRWRAGRVLLAGDAAHLSPPFVGQGLGLGLRDVHQLAWKLAAVLAGEAGDDLLDTYQAEREPHARALIGVAQLLGRLMTRRRAGRRRRAAGAACWPSSGGSRPWPGWRPTAGRRPCPPGRWSSAGAGPAAGWPGTLVPQPEVLVDGRRAGWTTCWGRGRPSCAARDRWSRAPDRRHRGGGRGPERHAAPLAAAGRAVRSTSGPTGSSARPALSRPRRSLGVGLASP